MKPLDRYLLLERKRTEGGAISYPMGWAAKFRAAHDALSPRDREFLKARTRVPGICPDHGWHGGWCMACRMVRK